MPNVVADAYVVDLDDAGGGMVPVAISDYEELNAVNHFLERHGIRFMLRGDLNNSSRGDGFVDGEDIDQLWDIWNDGAASALDEEWFDLTGDLALNMTINSGVSGSSEDSDIDELVKGILGTEYGDANLDRVVDDKDAAILASHWGMTGVSWCAGDFNGDGIVNYRDASLLSVSWLWRADAAAGEQVAVPEPSTLVLLLGLAAALAALRRIRRSFV
jgi:hypothetical protein